MGPTFRRKMTKAYLDMKAEGIFASERRVGQSLFGVTLIYHNHRQRGTGRLINPHPSTAKYNGHKLHVDQNETLARRMM